jgi:hypothetical protein
MSYEMEREDQAQEEKEEEMTCAFSAWCSSNEDTFFSNRKIFEEIKKFRFGNSKGQATQLDNTFSIVFDRNVFTADKTALGLTAT